MPFCDKNSHSMQIIPFQLIKTTLRSKFPFCRRGGFFCDSKKRPGSVGRRSQIVFSKKILPCIADTTPPAIAGTPSAEGEFCTAFDLNFPFTG